MAEAFPFWTEVLLLPAGALIINVLLRSAIGLDQSAPADLALMFLVFSGVLGLRADAVYTYSIFLPTADGIRSWFGAGVFVNLGSWIVALAWIERPLRPRHSLPPSVLRTIGLMVLSFFITLALIVYNMAPFALRVPLRWPW